MTPGHPFAGLPENLAAFCRTLRMEYGFRVGPGELVEAARALALIDVTSERAVRNALRPILCGTLDDTGRFDQAFTAFFLLRSHRGTPPERERDRSPRREVTDRARAAGDLRGTDDARAADDRSEAVELSSTAMERTVAAENDAVLAGLRYSPLSAEGWPVIELTPSDRSWRRAARALVRRVELGLSRRWRPARRGQRLDVRRTLRTSVQTGGEVFAPRWLSRPKRAARFIVLIDGSRSMSAAAETALRMAVSIASVTSRIEVFTFSTSLQRVTRPVRQAGEGRPAYVRSVRHAWGGGTDIGGCLREFLQGSGRRGLGRDTVVLIASDGLDVGSVDTLREAMRSLFARAGGVVWLNPLLETSDYQPIAAGMRAARPFVSTFASVSDARGLHRLARMARERAL